VFPVSKAVIFVGEEEEAVVVEVVVNEHAVSVLSEEAVVIVVDDDDVVVVVALVAFSSVFWDTEDKISSLGLVSLLIVVAVAGIVEVQVVFVVLSSNIWDEELDLLPFKSLEIFIGARL